MERREKSSVLAQNSKPESVESPHTLKEYAAQHFRSVYLTLKQPMITPLNENAVGITGFHRKGQSRWG